MTAMVFKSARNSKRAVSQSPNTRSSTLLMDGHDLLDPFAAGTWIPHVDICETEKRILVRAELPGVNLSDIAISFQNGSLRLQGIKREPEQSRKLLCYYCLERRYGSFDRRIDIDWTVNPRLARAYLDKGILTIELPKLKNRRGGIMQIPVRE